MAINGKRALKMIFSGVAGVSLVTAMLTGCAKSDADQTSSKVSAINVISREDGSGTRGAFISLFGIEIKNGDTVSDMTTDEAMIVNKTDVMLMSVAGDKNAIGYVSIGSLSDTVKAVKIDGVEATAENVKNGSYPVSRPFMIATKGVQSGLTKDFIDFMLSSEGQAVVAVNYIEVDENAPAYSSRSMSGKLVVAGSSSVAPVMEKLKEAYEDINPSVEIEIQISDSTSGMTGTIDGICDIGMSSRDLKDSEKAVLSGYMIAIDGIAVIINNDNQTDNLLKEQVKAIYTGEVTEWNDLR